MWYGPDTYMGRNLAQLFTSLAELPDEEVQKLHPQHTQASVKALLPRLHYFEEGTCIVHHIFGGEVTELVRKAYGDAYLTAHFEVCSLCHCLQPLQTVLHRRWWGMSSTVDADSVQLVVHVTGFFGEEASRIIMLPCKANISPGRVGAWFCLYSLERSVRHHSYRISTPNCDCQMSYVLLHKVLYGGMQDIA